MKKLEARIQKTEAESDETPLSYAANRGLRTPDSGLRTLLFLTFLALTSVAFSADNLGVVNSAGGASGSAGYTLVDSLGEIDGSASGGAYIAYHGFIGQVSTPQVSGPQLTVTPASADFGTLVVGQTSTQVFRILNSGGQTLTGTIAVATPFAADASGFNILAGQTGLVNVVFAPLVVGSFTNNIVFASNGGDSTNAVTGAAVAPGQIVVNPASLDFGTIATGTTSQRVFTVTNTGGATVSNGTASVAAPFSVVSGAAFSLPPSGSTNVVIQFAPVAGGAFTNPVIIATANGGSSTNLVTGAGATPPVASFTGTPTTGTAPLTVTFTDTSTGDITNRFWDFGDGPTLNTTATSVAHTYNTPGTYTPALTVYGPAGSDVIARQNYIVVVTPGQIVVTPGSLDFGAIATGTTSQRVFVVSNTGDTAVSNGTITVSAPFRVVVGGAFNIGAHGVFNAVIEFAPLAAGSFTNMVVFTTANGGSATNPVTGTGFAVPVAAFTGTPTNGVAPLVVTFTDTSTGTITNRSWSFGDGTTSNTLATTVTHTYANPGTNNVTLTVSGPAGSDSLTRNTYIVVAPGTVAITLSNAPPTGGTSTGAGTYAIGSNVVAVATPSAGYTFVNWTENGVPVCTTSNYTFVAAANRNLIANFAGLTIVTASPLPTGTVGIVYSNVFQATGGFPPYHWSVTGRLPAGLKFTAASALLTGKPTAAGTSTFTVRVADKHEQSVQKTFTLVIRDVFGPLAGTYNGLVLPTNAPTFGSSGSIKLVLSKTGSFAANLSLGGKKTVFKGQFDAAGNATNTFTSTPRIVLQLDVTGLTDQITGTVGASTLLADRAVYSASKPCPFAGKYNCLLEPTTNLVTVPQGDGYATLTVVASGNGALAGALADGTAINLTMPVSKHGTWPLYKLLYGSKGAAISWVTLTNTVTGVVDWFKPPTSGRYPVGFNTVLTLLGTKYPSPAVAGNWQLTLGQGNLPSNLTYGIAINTAGTVTLPATNTYKLSLKVTPATGKFTGSFVHPSTNKKIPFTGLFLQPPETEAGGFFLGPSTSGFVTLEP